MSEVKITPGEWKTGKRDKRNDIGFQCATEAVLGGYYDES